MELHALLWPNCNPRVRRLAYRRFDSRLETLESRVRNMNHPLPTHRNTKASQHQLPCMTPRLPQVDPLAQFKALVGITHPSKASGATPDRCAHAHPPDSLLKIEQNTIRPKWDDEGPSIPLRSAKEHKGNNTTSRDTIWSVPCSVRGLRGFSRIPT
jgi:hypothetical protein